MAIIIYNNGITEEYSAENLVFTEDEIVRLFEEFEEIKTRRLVKILNTWCVYGYNVINDSINFNKIASDIVEEDVYSPVLCIHDSEINPNWKVTDTILYNGYSDFLLGLKNVIEKSAKQFLDELESIKEYNENVDKLPQLYTIGTTSDKRMLFSYNPDEQSNDFYKNEEFYNFSQKVYKYISSNKQKSEPFTIYADNKAVIIIDTPNVNKFLSIMLEKFKSIEEYEICVQLTKIIDEWDIIIKSKYQKNADNKKSNKNK